MRILRLFKDSCGFGMSCTRCEFPRRRRKLPRDHPERPFGTARCRPSPGAEPVRGCVRTAPRNQGRNRRITSASSWTGRFMIHPSQRLLPVPAKPVRAGRRRLGDFFQACRAGCVWRRPFRETRACKWPSFSGFDARAMPGLFECRCRLRADASRTYGEACEAKRASAARLVGQLFHRCFHTTPA